MFPFSKIKHHGRDLIHYQTDDQADIYHNQYDLDCVMQAIEAICDW